jgi:hypothetical protein
VTIDEYLARLRQLLGSGSNARTLAEVEEHLRDAAAAAGSESEAVARFGAPEAIAASLSAERVAGAARLTVVAAIVGVGGFLVAYVAAENLLPPAPWPSAAEAPALLRFSTLVGSGLFAAAAAGTLAALLLAFIGRASASLLTAAASALAIAAAALVVLVGDLRRATLYGQLDVAGRLSALEVAVGTVYLGSLALLAVAAAWSAVRVWLTAHRASRSYGLSR